MKITYDPRYLKRLFQFVMSLLAFQDQFDTPETGCVDGEDSFVAIEQHSLERIIWRFLSAGNRRHHAIRKSHSAINPAAVMDLRNSVTPLGEDRTGMLKEPVRTAHPK